MTTKTIAKARRWPELGQAVETLLRESDTFMFWWLGARDRYFDHNWLVEPPVSYIDDPLARWHSLLPFGDLQSRVVAGDEDVRLDKIIETLVAAFKRIVESGISPRSVTLVSHIETIRICANRRQWRDGDQSLRRRIELGLVQPVDIREMLDAALGGDR